MADPNNAIDIQTANAIDMGMVFMAYDIKTTLSNPKLKYPSSGNKVLIPETSRKKLAQTMALISLIFIYRKDIIQRISMTDAAIR